jgi:hypothetical protein
MTNETLTVLTTTNDPVSTFILTFANVILAVATIGLLYFSYMLYIETKKMRVLQTQPEISIYTSRHPRIVNFINLTIKNTGPGTAYNVKFSVNQDVYCGPKQMNKLLKDLPLIRDGLQTMSPNQEFQFLLTHLLDYSESTVPSLVILVSYQSIDGIEYNKTYNFDLTVYWGLIGEHEDDLHEISETLKSINEKLEVGIKVKS